VDVFCLSVAVRRARTLSSNASRKREAFRSSRLLSPGGVFPLASFIRACALASRPIERLSRRYARAFGPRAMRR
jgi:hypothetical protein